VSFSVGIHLLWDHSELDIRDTWRRVLRCVPEPIEYLDFDGGPHLPKKFLREQVFDRCQREIYNQSVNSDDYEDVIALLDDYALPDVRHNVDSVFNFLDYEADKGGLFVSVGPMDFSFFGPQYCRGGFHRKTRGDLEISFSNLGSFLVDSALPPTIVEKLRGNYEMAVVSLAKTLVAETDPAHLVVCTESEVEPLTAHSIYHRDWREFFVDLEKIARLHEFGGGYFFDIPPDDPAFTVFNKPRKVSLDYGYLRTQYGDDLALELAGRLQPYVDRLLKSGRSLEEGSELLLAKTFEGLQSTKVERLKDSYLLTAHNSPFAYLEEPYFKLFEATL
jgi:hypothetical protein